MASPPLVQLRQFDTCRLIPSRFVDKEDSVLLALAEDEKHLADIFEPVSYTHLRAHET